MATTSTSRRLTAWIALAAMLFGAVSPALSAALFQHRPDVLGRMLAIPASAPAAPQAAATEDDGCPHDSAGGAGHEQASDAHHAGAGHEPNDQTDHAAHGIFCSFCLSASSVVTLLSPPPVLLAVAAGGSDVYLAPERRLGQAAPALHRARGPPFISC